MSVIYHMKLPGFYLWVSGLFIITACSLDQPEIPQGLLQKNVFEAKDLADQVLATAYLQIPGFTYPHGGDWCGPTCGVYGGGSQAQSLSDESHSMLIGGWEFMQEFYYKGGLQPTNAWAGDSYPQKMEDKYMLHYQSIRSCYDYLENCRNIKDANAAYINQRRGEALTIIAYHYYEMFKRYGGVPWVNKVYRSGENADLPRLSIKDMADSICSLLDRAIAIPEFEARHTTANYGRTNKMASMMLKARVRLVAASPLFNSDIFPVFLGDKAVLRYNDFNDPSAVQDRWKLAASTAREAIDFAEQNGYAIYDEGEMEKRENGTYFYWTTCIDPKESGTSNNRNLPWNGNTEVIWVIIPAGDVEWDACMVMTDPTNTFRSDGGTDFNCNQPLQNLVDLFELKDGSLQSEDPTFYSGAKPKYDQLDIRFKHTIAIQGEVLDIFGKSLTVNFMDVPGRPTSFSERGTTGYHRRKNFNDQQLVFGSSASVIPAFNLMRLAELYLIYAEALNESDPGNPDILKYLNMIRERSGQPKLEDCTRFRNTQDYVRACIRNERAVELAFEGHRYFDLRRWMMGYKPTGEDALLPGHGSIQGPMQKMEISGNFENPTYTIKDLEPDRVFSDKWYLTPFPQSEIYASQKMAQNPGW